MALVTRIARLFRADLHAVLDRIEEPEVVLRQAVREMEDALAQDLRRLESLRLEQGRLATSDCGIEETLQGIEEELDVCFSAGKEDLARVLLRRRLEAQQLRAVLARRRTALEEGLSTLEARMREQRNRLEATRRQADLLAKPDNPVVDEGTGIPEWPRFTVSAEDVEVALLREKQRRARP